MKYNIYECDKDYFNSYLEKFRNIPYGEYEKKWLEESPSDYLDLGTRDGLHEFINDIRSYFIDIKDPQGEKELYDCIIKYEKAYLESNLRRTLRVVSIGSIFRSLTQKSSPYLFLAIKSELNKFKKELSSGKLQEEKQRNTKSYLIAQTKSLNKDRPSKYGKFI